MRAHRPKDAKRRAPQRAGPGEREESAHAHLGGGGGERERERERERDRQTERERARARAMALLFTCFFLPPGPALCKLGLAMQIGLARSAVLPEVLTPVLGPFFVLFSRAFPFLVF